jgi:hypothetical protein
MVTWSLATTACRTSRRLSARTGRACAWRRSPGHAASAPSRRAIPRRARAGRCVAR